MRRKIITSAVLIVVLLAAGGGVMYLLMRTRPAPGRVDLIRPALLVEAVKVVPQTLAEPIVGYGTARADRYARLSAQVFGEIVELAPDLKPGASVRTGDVLIHIDDREYQQMLSQARAGLKAEEQQLAQLDVEKDNLDRLIEIVRGQLEIQQREYDRVKALREQAFAHVRESDQQQLALETLRAQLQSHENARSLCPTRRAALAASCERRRAEVEIAKLNVERCTIAAPFGGQVDELMVEIGERVQVGMPLLSLLDPDLLEVPIELPVSVRDRVGAGAPCKLSLESADPTYWRGQVRRVSASANQATRTFSLYVEVDNRAQAFPLMQGYFLRAVIEGPTLADVLVVPRGAIQQDRVFVYEAGHAFSREVQVTRHLLDRSVVSGLNPGEVVITSNLDALYEGAPVRLQETGLAPAGQVAAKPETGSLVDPK